MRKFAVIMPLFALVAGAFGFIIRRLELINVFDDFSGMPARGQPITRTLIALSVAVLAISLLFAIFVKINYKSPPGFNRAFSTDNVLYPIFFFVMGMAWILATLVNFVGDDSIGTLRTVSIYFAGLSFLAAVSMIIFAGRMYKSPNLKSNAVLTIVPPLFMCFWLIFLYQSNAANPVLLSYAYHCLALIASTLSFYLISGYACNKGAPGKMVFFSVAAIFFCGVTLADHHSTGTRVIIAVILVMNFVHLLLMLRNLQSKSAMEGEETHPA